MRDKIWMSVRSKLPEGSLQSVVGNHNAGDLIPARFLLLANEPDADTSAKATPGGLKEMTYSAVAMRWLAKAQGETYRVTRTGETVTLSECNRDRNHSDWSPSSAEISAVIHQGVALKKWLTR